MAHRRMPALFIGHGSPMNAINDNEYAREWAAIGQRVGTPRAIVCISAHWETETTEVCAAAEPETIHDFYGFPPALHAVRYPAPGAPALATRVVAIVGKASTTERWGLDHGAWQVLVHLFPNADVPTLQVSLARSLNASEHLAVGEALRPLRDEGVLILASGNIVHNLARLSPGATPSWASEFDAYVRDALVRRDREALTQYARAGASARLAVPTAEHYLPLLYAFGASDERDRLEFACESFDLGSIAMRCVGYYA
jgi:4,5-DOPA dioxygenase extradiol